MQLFGASENQVCQDVCLKNILQFVKTVSQIESRDTQYSTIKITIGQRIMCEYGQFNESSMACIVKNMVLRGNCDEAGGNASIAKDINADELPKGFDIEFHMDDDKGEYDYYVIKWACTPQYANNENKYLDVIESLLRKNEITIKSTTRKSLKHKQASIVVKWF